MWRRRKISHIEFDEIVMDAKNVPGFRRENLEGVVEFPIQKKVFVFLGTVFFFCGLLFLGRVWLLQVVRGEAMRERSANNYLRYATIEPERGIIYDRNKEPLSSSELQNSSSTLRWFRRYPSQGFLHVLGFLSRDGEYPKGVSGLEAFYDDILQGNPGKQIEEVDARGQVLGSGLWVASTPGRSILTSLSKDLQITFAEAIEKVVSENGYKGGAGVIMDVRNGDVVALVSVPEFDPNLFRDSSSKETIEKLIRDPGRPFFNRAVSGIYPPGSAIKPAVAAAALSEKIIDPEKKIFSSGALVLPNPYFPDKPNIFRDWKAHGWVDMKSALAVSSNEYFYTIGGGYRNQPGLGVENIEKYLKLFSFGSSTGIDLPGEKEGSLPDLSEKQNGREWSIGDTYHLSIGQGGLVVTPIQMAVYATALASKGILYQPHIAVGILDEHKDIVQRFEYTPLRTNILPDDIFSTVQTGMREVALSGTASFLSNFSMEVALKTGTAEIGNTGRVHSWSIGFFPYKDPKLAYAVVLEDRVAGQAGSATTAVFDTIQWIVQTDFLSRLDKKE